MGIKTSVLLLAAASLAFSAVADQITFIHTGKGSGLLNGVFFSDADFTITGIGDTSTRVTDGDAYSIVHTSATIQIAGVGTYTFLTQTITAANLAQGNTYFSNGAADLALMRSGSDASVSGWDMLSSFGPISGPGDLLQWGNSPVNTDGGILEFRPGSSPSTFQAIVVPVPSSLALLGVSGVVAGRRRR